MSEIPNDLRETQIVDPRTEEIIVPGATCSACIRYGITATGISRAHHAFYRARVRPHISVVMVCFGGEGRALVDGRWQRCSEGMAYVMPRRALHAYSSVEQATWNVCWVIYEPPGQLPTSALLAPTLLHVGATPLPQIVDGLYREYLGAGEASAMNLWVELIHLEVNRITRKWHADGRLSRLWEVVNASLNEVWTIDDLAQQAGMSSESLRTLCHKHLGRSPGRQLTHLRMQHASYLLKATNWKVDQVARTVGYDNAFAFSTAFKRWAGRAPSQFRLLR